jgi:uncharacterized phage infection (PIP) family protein YhgE
MFVWSTIDLPVANTAQVTARRESEALRHGYCIGSGVPGSRGGVVSGDMARWLLMTTVALALIAGCGGDDNSSGGGGSSELSQDELVSKANEICREGATKINAKAQDIQKKIQEAKSAEEQQKAVADALEETAKEYDPYLDQLKDLNPPEELQADWDKFVDGINNAFDLIPDLASATRDGDRDKLSELTTKFSQIAGDTRPFAQKYELDDCLPDNSTDG